MAMPDFVGCSLVVNRLSSGPACQVVWGGGLNTPPYPIMCGILAHRDETVQEYSQLMTNQALETLRGEVLALPEEERAELAFELVSSLDGTADSDVAEAWDVEILRRLAEIDAGTAKLIDREEFRRRIRDRLASD